VTDIHLLLRAAAEAAGAQQYPAPALYVVATPIGNLADITLRALHVLAIADVVACEDTRVSASLLQRFGLHKPLLALHDHNERAASTEVVAHLQRGARVAYVSDAGTPAISDPGAALVASVRDGGWPVRTIPGASSATAAFSVAGDVGATGFRFEGFLPSKGTARQQAIERAAGAAEAVVWFEAPHRIASLTTALAEAAADRRVTICRELTKQFETVQTMRCADTPAWLAADANRLRGEFVVVLHARAADDTPKADFETTLAVLLRELPLKQAVALCAEICAAPRNAVYAQALVRRQQGDP
jgi:16S rRNA (cytidine1402-2'-O)-methyltransferase